MLVPAQALRRGLSRCGKSDGAEDRLAATAISNGDARVFHHVAQAIGMMAAIRDHSTRNSPCRPFHRLISG